MTNETLIIFVRHPEIGKVKTRLAKEIGDTKALEVYIKLLDITKAATEGLPQHKQVWYADNAPSRDIWDGYEKHMQPPGDIGQKMRHSLQKALKMVSKACLIGSDCPGVSQSIIEEAFHALDKHDVVIGPAMDGGYYLIGMKCFHPQLFESITWSTEKVYLETIEKIKSLGLTYHSLPILTDIDTIHDLRQSMPEFLD